jgi:capsular exopolysaccharide synthesis family protein
VATAVFEPAHNPQSAESAATAAHDDESPLPPLQKQDAVAELQTPESANGSSTFPSLEVSVTPSSPLVFFTQPESLAAEKFRFLGVRLRQMRQTRPLKKVLITSTIPEEGKSLVSANLSGVLARRKERVLLVEGDMRRPTLSNQFGLGRLAGLAEWLQGGLEKPWNIYRLSGAGFWIMPAGDPPANPLELMQSGRLASLMGQLANLFDWIIVDSPPLLPLADSTVWARLTDGALLVVREGKTQRRPLERGLEIIKKSDLLGVVLNGCSNTDHDSYYQRYSPPGTK